MSGSPNPGRRRGFTFVEVLAAMLFMAIVLPVTVEGIMLANTVEERATKKRIAAELADQVLTEAVATESWRDGDQSGDFGDDFPGYTWSLTNEGWSEDTMQLVKVDVSYTVQGKQFTETLSTLADIVQGGAGTDSSTSSGSSTGATQ